MYAQIAPDKHIEISRVSLRENDKHASTIIFNTPTVMHPHLQMNITNITSGYLQMFWYRGLATQGTPGSPGAALYRFYSITTK